MSTCYNIKNNIDKNRSVNSYNPLIISIKVKHKLQMINKDQSLKAIKIVIRIICNIEGLIMFQAARQMEAFFRLEMPLCMTLNKEQLLNKLLNSNHKLITPPKLLSKKSLTKSQR